MPLWPAFRLKSSPGKTNPAAEADRDAILRLFLSDAVCELDIRDKAGCQLHHLAKSQVTPASDPLPILTGAIAAIPNALEERIGTVEVFLDDPGIAIIDSRQAKLTHFDGRALAEYGQQQLGGKACAFASRVYGEASEHEVEKRILAYLPEDRLTLVLFALGKLSRYTTYCGPWSLQSALPEGDTEPSIQLTVHTEFSTLILANGVVGAVAARNLALGTATFVTAYAEEFGLSLEEAACALQSRERLDLTRDGLPGATSPMAHLGSFAALSSAIKELSEELRTTTDYFEFQRLAGRSGKLRLLLIGEPIAGLRAWLAATLGMEVEAVDRAAVFAANANAMNFLGGMRSGLLKIGHQLYDFEGGRFVPSKATGPAAGNQSSGGAGLLARLQKASAQPVTLAGFKNYIPHVAAAACLCVMTFLANMLLFSPVQNTMEVAATDYQSAVMGASRQSERQPVDAPEPMLWARDLLVMTSVMPYDMKLTRVNLAAAKPGAEAALTMEGALPKDGQDNLRLVSGFMARLAAHRAGARQLADIALVSAGEGENKTTDEFAFHLTAKVSAVRR